MLAEYPWRRPEATVAVSAHGSPRLHLSGGRSPEWMAPIGLGVPASFPYKENSLRWQAWYLPTPHRPSDGRLDFECTWNANGIQGRAIQVGMVYRDDKTSVASEYLGQHIRRCVNAFNELAHFQDEKRESRMRCTGPGFSRQDWDLVREIWLDSRGGEPQMSLIVRLAKNAKLLETLDSIARKPREILSRVREETRLSRIRELDATCIRDYARRPGITAVEKAGPRQTLMAVQRIPNRDTLENRTMCWCLEELQARGTSWLHDHAASDRKSNRAQSVARLVQDARAWRNADTLLATSSLALQHPVQPNYPLQLDSRYRQIYKLYEQLYREKKVEDEAWTWRHVLWAHAARQMIACALLHEDKTSSGLPYFRTEQDRGQWLHPGSAPSPIPSAHGDGYWIDSIDVSNMDWLSACPRPWMRDIGMLGCDAFLWWRQADCAVLFWPLVLTGDPAETAHMPEDAALALELFKKELHPGIRLTGFILAAYPGSEVNAISYATPNGPQVTCVLIPMGLDSGDAHAMGNVNRVLRSNLKNVIKVTHGH